MVIPVCYTYPHTGAHTRIHDNYVSFRALIRDSLTRVTEISFKKLIVCGAYGFTSARVLFAIMITDGFQLTEPILWQGHFRVFSWSLTILSFFSLSFFSFLFFCTMSFWLIREFRETATLRRECVIFCEICFTDINYYCKDLISAGKLINRSAREVQNCNLRLRLCFSFFFKW